MSYKAEVIADGSGKWVGNALRFPTRQEAESYGLDLALRWTLVREVRVTESDEPVNYVFVGSAPVRPLVYLQQLCGTWPGGRSRSSPRAWAFQTYVGALPLVFDAHGLAGLVAQVPYIISNARARTPEQKDAKAKLQAFYEKYFPTVRPSK